MGAGMEDEVKRPDEAIASTRRRIDAEPGLQMTERYLLDYIDNLESERIWEVSGDEVTDDMEMWADEQQCWYAATPREWGTFDTKRSYLVRRRKDIPAEERFIERLKELGGADRLSDVAKRHAVEAAKRMGWL